MRRSLARFAALERSERSLLLEAFLIVAAATACVRCFGFAACSRWLSRATWPRSRADPAAVARMIAIAARRTPLRVTCLPRSLALHWMLRRRGIESTLRIGVRKRGDHLEAHAWVEQGGQPLLDDADVGLQFAPFRLDETSAARVP